MRILALLAGLSTLLAQPVPQHLSADTPESTVLGNSLIAPKDWSLRVNGPATILETPEGGSFIALVDLSAKDADAALAAAWRAYRPDIASLRTFRSTSA